MLTTAQTDRLFAALDAFRIELPSWGFANTGTRFGKFLQDTAAVTTDDGALKFVSSCGEVPVKSIVAERRRRSTVTRTAMTAPE